LIKVDLSRPAAVLDPSKNSEVKNNYTIDQVRSGKIKNTWLLSGGALIFDQNNKLALGLRDGNAADPFCFTNIGAGRCDQKVIPHCQQELSSEFILCIKRGSSWQQVSTGPNTKPIEELELPCVEKKLKRIIKRVTKSETALSDIMAGPPENPPLPLKKVLIKWGDIESEAFESIIWLDEKNHTVEIRLPVYIDLTDFSETAIFFNEGTGFAVWKSLESILALSRFSDRDRAALVTPSLKYLAKAIRLEE
jgi:hypothetical protein